MEFSKNFCRFICNEELDKDQIIEFFDIVQSVGSTKIVSAYDETGDSIEASVMMYDSEDGANIYEIVLTEQLDIDEGEEIGDLLNEAFDFDFEFETSLEI